MSVYFILKNLIDRFITLYAGHQLHSEYGLGPNLRADS